MVSLPLEDEGALNMSAAGGAPPPEVQAWLNNLGSLPVPRFYVNSVVANLSPTEITMILSFANTPQATVSLPLPLAKSVVRLLGRMVEDYEKAAGMSVPYVEEMSAKMSGPQP